MQLISDFQRDGHICCRGLLSPDSLDRLREQLESALGLDATNEASFLGIRDAVPLAQRIITEESILSVAHELLKTDTLRLWQDQVIQKRPNRGSESAWHQDHPFLPIKAPTMLTCWIPLHDVDTVTGCLRFVSGSHLWTTKATLLPLTLDEVLSKAEKPREVAATSVVECAMKLGDVSFHHGLVYHSALPNYSTSPRLSYKLVLIADGTEYRFHYHSLTIGKGFKDGDPICGGAFPIVSVRE